MTESIESQSLPPQSATTPETVSTAERQVGATEKEDSANLASTLRDAIRGAGPSLNVVLYRPFAELIVKALETRAASPSLPREPETRLSQEVRDEAVEVAKRLKARALGGDYSAEVLEVAILARGVLLLDAELTSAPRGEAETPTDDWSLAVELAAIDLEAATGFDRDFFRDLLTKALEAK